MVHVPYDYISAWDNLDILDMIWLVQFIGDNYEQGNI